MVIYLFIIIKKTWPTLWVVGWVLQQKFIRISTTELQTKPGVGKEGPEGVHDHDDVYVDRQVNKDITIARLR